jgi:hypothetical protein
MSITTTLFFTITLVTITISPTIDTFARGTLERTLVLFSRSSEDELIKSCLEDNLEYKSCLQFFYPEKPETISFLYPASTSSSAEKSKTAEVSTTNDQEDRYYEGLDWQEICENPLVRNYISQPCEVLVTPDGNALTSLGKQSMENLLCPQGPSILSTIELFYGQMPDNLKNELTNVCGWA